MGAVPTVSVIIPTYNCAAYLPETLASVRAQTLTDVEIIVVDDGSTDDTRALLESAPAPIVYIPMPHSGRAAKARNRGLLAARGTFVAFLDADDLWHPTKLERQVRLLEREPGLDICFTDYVTFGIPGDHFTAFSGLRPQLAALPKRAVGDGEYVVTTPAVLEYHLRRGPIPFWTSAMLVRRQCFDTVGLFKDDVPLDDDTQMWMRLAQHFGVAFIDAPLAQRRLRASSLTGSSREMDGFRYSLETLDTLHEWLKLTPGERQAARALAARIESAAGYHEFAAGRLATARGHFWRSLRRRPSLRAALYGGAALLPGALVAGLRRLKQRLSLGSRALPPRAV
jgi:glycosyltransferase involved in cell wall biosynthesis